MKAVIYNRNRFDAQVFGADCFLQWWPELLTTGVEVEREAGCGPKDSQVFYYVVDPKTGRRANDTAFFTGTETRGCIKIIKEEE